MIRVAFDPGRGTVEGSFFAGRAEHKCANLFFMLRDLLHLGFYEARFALPSHSLIPNM